MMSERALLSQLRCISGAPRPVGDGKRPAESSPFSGEYSRPFLSSNQEWLTTETPRTRNTSKTDQEMPVKLQVALDVATLGDALTLARQVAEYVDILELGTPLIKSEGVSAIGAIKAAHPDKLVFADLKTADAGELEADLAFAAGADVVTVMGTADDDTISGAVAAGKKAGRKVVADMITVVDGRVKRIREVSELGVDFVEIHAGLDEQARPDYSIEALLVDGREAGVPFSIAGGVSVHTIASVKEAGAEVAVVGGSIYSADDPAAAAKALREAAGLPPTTANVPTVAAG
jgi:3-hexulose-6-phosphate synthase